VAELGVVWQRLVFGVIVLVDYVLLVLLKALSCSWNDRFEILSADMMIVRLLVLLLLLRPLEWFHSADRFALILILEALLNCPELSLLGASCRVDLVCQLLIHHPLARESVLQLSYPAVYPSHLLLTHRQLQPLLGYHIVLLLVQLSPVGQFSSQLL